MFLGVSIIGLLLMFFYLWGDYIKILIFIEILSVIFISLVLYIIKIDFFSINFFFFFLVFLVCESRIGFLLFIFYISMEFEVVKKLNLIQF